MRILTFFGIGVQNKSVEGYRRGHYNSEEVSRAVYQNKTVYADIDDILSCIKRIRR